MFLPASAVAAGGVLLSGKIELASGQAEEIVFISQGHAEEDCGAMIVEDYGSSWIFTLRLQITITD